MLKTDFPGNDVVC